MTRTQWTLVGLLALQLILLFVTGGLFAGSGSAAARTALLPVLQSITPTRIQITEGAEDSVALRRDGEDWTLEDAGGYPADSDRVRELLDSLERLQVGRPVVSSSRYHEALEVTEGSHQRRLRLWEDASGDPDVDLFLGSSPNYQISHVRVGGDDRVYEVRGLNAYDLRADADSWVQKKFIDVPFEDVTRLELRNEHGAFEVTRDEDRGWTLTSGTVRGALDQAKVNAVVRALASLWLAEPAGRIDPVAQGLDEPVATVELAYRGPGPGGEDAGDVDAATEDGEGDAASAPASAARTVTLTLGREVEGGDGKRYAARSGFDFAVVLSKFDAEKATTKKLADLLADADADADAD